MAELKIQRHPLIIDHDTQTIVEMDLRPGESLYSFLSRHIVNLDGMQVTVHIGGKPAPRHLWHCIYPKHGNDILVRNVLERTALLIVALIVLSIFTMGAAAAVAGAAGAAGGVIGAAGFAVGTALGTGVVASIAVGAMQVIGAMIINKVLGPKAPSASSIDRDSVYSLSAVRNSARQYEPMGLLFGEIQVTPDVITIPYSVYQGNDQYMSLVLSAGVNVAEYEDLYIGDTLLSNFEEIQVWQSGFSNMPNQVIPISGNVDTETGPELEANVEVIRTTSVDTVRIQVDVSFLLFDLTTKGKKRNNQETILISYRPVGTDNWAVLGSYDIVCSDQTQQRRSYIKDVSKGQYEVSVKRLGRDTGTVQPSNSEGATAEFTWTTLVSYQEDTANYRGISRIGMTMRATGQFSGTPDQIRGLMRARPIPLWNGTQWVTATNRANGLSNVAANVLKYLRGYYDEDNVLIAGMGWTDDQIDIEAFKEWMVDCTLYNWNYDAWITSDRNHDEMLSSLALCGLGKIDFAPGKATPVWSAPGQAETAIVNMGTITKASFQVDYTLARSADGIEYSYYDREKNDTVTLRVTAPGVEVMLNPARLTGEGVTTEAHAAYMARYHMAQMLYQLKDVAYTTHIEFMTYGLLDVIQLQHDLTQWAYGGRLKSFYIGSDNRPVVTLDDAVPYPTDGREAYIGLRVPGELICRIFKVTPFSGTRVTLHLEDPWPVDATLPGNDIDENPVHDTLWMYDFKENPGYRCRVISISPADDLKTGAIAVVPEGPEFWVYVETGVYVSPPNQSLLNVSPIATNLIAKEVRVTQGNTVFSQINITWNVAGFADNCIVTCAGEDGIPQEVAVTSGRSASWRVEGPGNYLIVVRPYRNGVPGKATTGQLLVYGENQPPVNPDVFAIDDLDGGIRKYAWGWYAQTIQSSDFAGVEIRYTEGSVPTPNWNAMTPLGDDNDGFHPATFESTLPVSGQYTFSLRARNTAGVLSDVQLVLTKTLSKNLGERYLETVNQLSINELRLTEAIEQIDVNSEAILQQETNISQINGREVQNRAYIAQLQETVVDEDAIRALVVNQVGVSTGDLTATVQEQSGAIANINGDLSAYYNVKVQLTSGGVRYLAGIGLGIDAAAGGTPQSEVVMLADRLVFMNQITGTPNFYYPFEIVGGVVHMNTAMIQDASITNAKIGNYIQSDNFQWNSGTGTYTGWQIMKDGSAKFGGDVTVRGNIFGDKIIGEVQKKTVASWSGSIAASTGATLLQFTLDTPLLDGESHIPFIQLTIDVNNSGGDPARGQWYVERIDGSTWTTLKTREYYLGGNENAAISITVPDDSTTTAETYRVRVADAGLRSSQFIFTNIAGIVIGVR